VVLADGADVTGEQLREHLAARVPKWWLPDEFVLVAEVPKTSTGKFDKKLLRDRLRAGDLPTGNTARAHASGDGGSRR
jgi:fatty-acyl-CoA synthase